MTRFGLALGLSDVVQACAGGMRVGAIVVDDGSRKRGAVQALADGRHVAIENRRAMTDSLAYTFVTLVALVAAGLALQIFMTLRKPRSAMPAELDARLRLLEQHTQSLIQAVARTEGQIDHIARGLDDRLQHTIVEARSGRQELTAALRDFEAKVDRRLAAIQADNERRLDEMRQTVDEKLSATLEQRLGESFRLVSERLEQVHAGLGEMKTLAGSVGDLKRVMTNVRARGTWGEMQLGAIIESLLTAEQFGRNVKTVPGSDEWVEFAIRMPGRSDDQPVWLPIDSKYPVEDYQRLVDAHETIDKGLIQQASAAFEASIRNEAKKIAAKYLAPPQTTDFAILFVPTEGLFAEVLRIPGLVEALQTQHRVVVAGPTTLAAMLNSLRLGFRTLAIEQRSSEVWGILAAVKTEFRRFGEVVESTKKSIDVAANKFTELGRRTRAIERGLRDVESLPLAAPSTAIGGDAAAALDDEGGAASNRG